MKFVTAWSYRTPAPATPGLQAQHVIHVDKIMIEPSRIKAGGIFSEHYRLRVSAWGVGGRRSLVPFIVNPTTATLTELQATI